MPLASPAFAGHNSNQGGGMIPPPDLSEGAMLKFVRKRAVASLISLVGLIVNLVSDLTYTWIDPRIDFETRET